MSELLVKSEKMVRVKVRGKTVDLVREQYLRTDIPCGAQGCPNCVQGENKSRLPSDNVSHYLIALPDVAIKYLEILEFPEITGMIFPQTVVQQVLHDGGKRLYTRLCNIVRDIRKESFMFVNEFCQQTYVSRRTGESLAAWRVRAVYNVGLWYHSHFDGQIAIVLITENAEVIKQYQYETDGVFVITLGNYLKNFFPTLETAFNIYESLGALLSIEETSESTTDFAEHLQLEILENGVKVGRYYQGMLRVNKHHAKTEAFVSFLSVDNTEELASDILVLGVRHRNRAIHGDTVVVELLPRAEWRGRITALNRHEEGDVDENNCTSKEVLPTAKVVGILQRNWRDYVVSLSENENFSKAGAQERVLSIPYDCRIPKIRILTRQASTLVGQRIVVRIDSWEVNSQYPNGHFVRSLGKIGAIETETMTILVENEIFALPFSPGVVGELPVDTPDHPWTVDPSEVARRQDLRTSHLIFSIDPKGCVDVDDALSAKRLPNEFIEIGVHIADVTHFVRPNTYTDLDARSRGNTVYLADRCYHMLPNILSANLCSLKSKVDRFAVSVFWILDQSYHVVDVWYGQTAIHSSYSLCYEVAQEIIDGKKREELSHEIPELDDTEPSEVNERFDDLKNAVALLTEVAHVLKDRRGFAGALELDSSEIQLEFRDADRSGNLDSIRPKQELDIHGTVAECMIFANHLVAKKIKDTFQTRALLRRHPPPRQDQFGALLLLAESREFQLDTSSNKSLARSLDRCVVSKNTYVNKIMRSVTVQAMSMAVYFATGTLPPEDYCHYGLALDVYTHFTSPIRRYADIIVHRLLLDAVKQQHECPFSCSSLQEVCDHINKKQRAAKNAQRASQELFKCVFFDSLTENDERRKALAIVFALRANGVLTYLPRYGIKAPLYLRNREQQVAFVVDHKVEWTSGSLKQEKLKITVTTGLGQQPYHIFDAIMVRVGVEKSPAHASTIKLDLLDNCVSPDVDLQDMTVLSGKDMMKEVTSCQKTLLDTESAGTESSSHGYDATEADQKDCNTGRVSEFYLVLEDLRKMALQEN